MNDKKNVSVLMFVAGSVLVAGGVSAQNLAAPQSFDLGLTAGATWSDNIALASANEQDGTIGQLGVTLGYNRESRRLRSDIDVNAAWQHYLDNEFDDDVIGGLNGTVVLGIAPEQFEWLFQDSFGQSRVNLFDALTPGNRQNVNYFTTGPDFTLRFGQATSLKLTGRYSATNYEEIGLDDERYSASLALIRRLSGASSVSLNAVRERFAYDDPAINEYDRHEAFLRYELGNARTTLRADAGYTAIDDDDETSDGTLLRLSLRRQTSPSASVSVNLGSEFSDSGSAFRAAQDQSGVSLDPELVIPTADAFERRYVLAGWDFARNRTSFGLNGEYTEEAYENLVALDRTVMRYAIYFGRQLNPTLGFRIDGRYSDEEFDRSNAKAEELYGSARLTWEQGRTLSWRLQFDFRDRTGSGLFAEYTENRASLFLTWSPLAQR